MVLRFMNIGPAALDNGDSLHQISGTLAEHAVDGNKLVAVTAAMTGVTDLLLDSITGGNYSNVYTKLLTSHTSAARRQGRDETARKVLIQDITDIMDTYRWLGKSLANRRPTPSETDTIALLGEKLSARLLAASLQNRRVQAASLSGSEFMVLGNAAEADMPATRERVEKRLMPLLQQDYVVVVTASLNMEMAQLNGQPQSELFSCTRALAACAAPDEIWSWLDSETYVVNKP